MKRSGRVKHELIFLPIVVGLLASFVCTIPMHAQESIGGPYQPDSATVLLMHFDETFSNASDFYNIASPEPYGNTEFLEMDGAGDLEYQLQLDNDSPDEKSHIQVPDTAALDLTGSRTMELWMNNFEFGTEDNEWDQETPFIMKPGEGSPDNSRGEWSCIRTIPTPSIRRPVFVISCPRQLMYS